jgi:hypothetical protein
MCRSPSMARLVGLLFFAFVATIQAERGTCSARRIDLPGPSTFFHVIVLMCLSIYWLDVDSRKTRVMRVWDMGFFMSVAWPIIVPYYLIRTCGPRRASLIFLLLAIVYFGVFVIARALCRTTQ